MCRTELFQHGVTETPLLEHPEDLLDLEYPELPDFVLSILQKITELLPDFVPKDPRGGLLQCDEAGGSKRSTTHASFDPSLVYP